MSTLRAALAERVVVADGAMGTMLQGSDATLDDFGDYEGCNEILNVTRPDIVTGVHEAYLDAGADCVTTNSFGANLSNLGEYGIADRDRGTLAGLRPAGPHRRRPLGHAGSSALGAWLAGPGHEAAHARPYHVPRAARLVPGQRGRTAAGRRRRVDRRDLPGPAPGQGGHHRVQAGGGSTGPGLAHHRPGHDRNDRRDAARQRDRRGVDRPGTARHRHDRVELRDRPGRDERAPALPGRPLPDPDLLRAERRPAHAHPRRRALPADPGAAGGRS